jgi:hypothetical protein
MKSSGCLFSWFSSLFGGGIAASSPDAAKLPRVIVNKRFVSPAEEDFFRVLRHVVGERGHVLAQVALGRLVWFPPGQEKGLVQRWRNKVAQKSVDFVVCEPGTLRPIVVIELDEPSHATPSRQGRDEDVHDILTAAGLPLVRVLTSRTYDTRELEEWLGPSLGAGGGQG